MAERRMFAKTIIDSDTFLDMPITTQLLYFHMSMRADDDGFLNNSKKIQRMIGCSDDDLRLLALRKFIIPFESGIVVIKHWKIHNYIRKDCYTETKYKNEKSLLSLDENRAYTKSESGSFIRCDDTVTSPLRYRDEYVTGTSTQERKGKVSKVKDSKDNNKRLAPAVYYPDETLNRVFLDFITMRKQIKAPMTDRAILLAMNKLEELATVNGVFDNDLAIKILNQSILNSWKGLFQIKQNGSRSTASSWEDA